MPKRNTTERRHQIIQAMQGVVAERGFEGASIAEVAKRAGLAPGLVHYHFKSKLEILLALLEMRAGDALFRVEEFLFEHQGAGPEERVGLFLDAFLEVASDFDPTTVACWVALAAEAIRQPEVKEGYLRFAGKAVGRLEALVLEALPEGASRREARRIAAALFATVQGYFVLGTTCAGLVPPRSAARTAREMAQALLANARREGGSRERRA